MVIQDNIVINHETYMIQMIMNHNTTIVKHITTYNHLIQ